MSSMKMKWCILEDKNIIGYMAWWDDALLPDHETCQCMVVYRPTQVAWLPDHRLLHHEQRWVMDEGVAHVYTVI